MIDIIIPVFHSRKTLPSVLNSLTSQTYKDFFITIVADGDEEDYSDIINTYTARGLVIQIITLKENVGPGIARQVAMDADDQSEYFMLCDSDDLLMPQAVESLLREIDTNNLDIVTSSFLRHKPNGNLLQDAATSAITWCAGKIYRASYLREKNIRFHPYLRLNEDSYFNVVAWNCAKKKNQLREVTVLMMDNPESLTRKDGIAAYFEKGWEQYILSQADGLRTIYDKNGTISPELVAHTLIYLYKECMIAVYYNYELTKAKTYLNKMNTNWMQESLGHVEFWNEIQENCKSVIMFDDTMIFPKLNFTEWLGWFI